MGRKLVVKVDLWHESNNSILEQDVNNAVLIEKSLPSCFTNDTVPIFMIEMSDAIQRFLTVLVKYHSDLQTQDTTLNESHNNTDNVFVQTRFEYLLGHL